ncbi:MAG: peptidylprolyl isomerase [Bacteroidota bacterium]|jgi:peptidyl-prolyl cis-trans isomerase SurA
MSRFYYLRNKLFLLLIILFTNQSFSQTSENIVDQIVGVVGNNIVLKSEVESQYAQLIAQGTPDAIDLKCRILDQLLLNKLLLHQANIDSLNVEESQVNQKIESNLSYFIQQIGSVEKLEQYYGKSIAELKEEFKPLIREQLLAQQMQSKVTKGVSSSPADVRTFFNKIPKDSLPYVNAELEYAQIVHYVPVSDEQKKEAKDKLKSIRDRIINGEDFSTLAVLYSQDIESAKQGGELGFVNRGDLVPEFSAAAFKLKNNIEISEIIESPFGYHIIQLIERRGEKINVRHILLRAVTQADDLVTAQSFSDSIANLIRLNKISFNEAAEKFSDDTETKLSGGIVINAATGSTKFESDQVDPNVLFSIDKMAIGEVSSATLITTRDGKQAYRILKLMNRSEPHQMNLTDDYPKLQELTLSEKQNTALQNWKNKKVATTYVRIAEEYQNCETLKDWSLNTAK